MAFSSGGFLFAVMVVVVTAAELMGNAAAATYVVGDTFGWGVPLGGPTTYTTWASQHVFRVGDVLVFNFSTGIHDVAQVTRPAFDGCSSTNPIALSTVGPASFTLNSTGDHYYICTFGQHCPLGQKLAINVTTASSTAPAPTPAPSSSPTVMPSPTPTPTPMPSSSPSPSQGPSPAGPTPSPTPSGGVAPSLSPASEMSPGSAPSSSSLPTGDLSPPPPPSSANTVATIGTPFIVFASIAYGFMI